MTLRKIHSLSLVSLECVCLCTRDFKDRTASGSVPQHAHPENKQPGNTSRATPRTRQYARRRLAWRWSSRGFRLARRTKRPSCRRLRAYLTQGRRLHEQPRAEHGKRASAGSRLQKVSSGDPPVARPGPRAVLRAHESFFVRSLQRGGGASLASAPEAEVQASGGVLSTVSPARVAAVPPADSAASSWLPVVAFPISPCCL